MSDLERIKQAPLSSVLTQTSPQLQRRLSDGELEYLAVLVGQMAQRYPAQDLEQSLEGYLADFEQLALKYSLVKVQRAMAELRITPGQKFFPRPDEVATVIEEQRERNLHIAREREGNEWLRNWKAHVRRVKEERRMEAASAKEEGTARTEGA